MENTSPSRGLFHPPTALFFHPPAVLLFIPRQCYSFTIVIMRGDLAAVGRAMPCGRRRRNVCLRLDAENGVRGRYDSAHWYGYKCIRGSRRRPSQPSQKRHACRGACSDRSRSGGAIGGISARSAPGAASKVIGVWPI